MNANLIAILAITVGGILAALQSPTNAALAHAFRSPVSAALMSFTVGTAALLAATALTRAPPDWPAIKALPWWAWLGGLYGAWFVVSAAFAAPRIGVATLVTFFLVGQLAASIAIDHFGLLGVPQRSVSVTRIAGLVLAIGGAILVRRG